MDEVAARRKEAARTMGCSSSKKESPLLGRSERRRTAEPAERRVAERATAKLGRQPGPETPLPDRLELRTAALRSGEPANFAARRKSRRRRGSLSTATRHRPPLRQRQRRGVARPRPRLLGHIAARPAAAIEKEFAEHGTADKVVVDYVVAQEGGVVRRRVLQRRQDGPGVSVGLPARSRTPRTRAFLKAKLEAYHVAGLRIYSTAAYKTIFTAAQADQRQEREDRGPITVLAIKEADMKLRVVALDDRGTSTGLDLYRGMRDMKAADDFGEKPSASTRRCRRRPT